MDLNGAYEIFKAGGPEDDFYKELLVHIRKMVHRRSHDRCTFYNIEDAITQSALEVWQGLERFDSSRGSFSSFVYLITRRNIQNIFRSLRRHGRQVLLDENVPARFIPADAQALLEEFKARLTPLNRKVLQMHLEGLTAAEIARALGIGLEASKSRLKRIRRRPF
jgi:RNA polymerase sigma factor (sigma-70 family)